MDFKTFKIIIMRKFSHTDIVIVAVPAILIALIVFNIITVGIQF